MVRGTRGSLIQHFLLAPLSVRLNVGLERGLTVCGCNKGRVRRCPSIEVNYVHCISMSSIFTSLELCYPVRGHTVKSL